MRRIALGVALLWGCGLLLVGGCSPDPVAGGTSTSENGRVAGSIVDSSGVPVADAQVTLLLADFDPQRNHETLTIDTTDTSGAYSFSGIVPGDYSIQSVHLSARTRGLRTGVCVRDTAVTLSQDTLRKPGTINVALPRSVDTASGYLYLPGTTISARLSGSDVFAVLDSVPAGIISRVAYGEGDTVHPVIWNDSVVVHPEDTVTVAGTGWNYRRRLRLNTTASGAAVDAPVYDFPVLIRLHKDNFDFTQANGSGSDIVFIKSSGTLLPCEIEQWDAVSRVGAVWVLLDTIAGNDSSGSITMYWGNSRVVNAGRQVVFDTADGFSGVWHMRENGDTVYDATQDRHHGLRIGGLEQTPGIIGYGQRFDSSRSYCDMGDVLNPGTGSFTVSAWVKRAAFGRLQTIFAKSKGGGPSATYGWSLSFATANNLHLFTASGGSLWGDHGTFDFWSKTDAAVVDTASWHYLAAVVDRSDPKQCRLYLDGRDVTDSANGNLGTVGALANSLPLRIGAEADGSYQWTGIIDECVIANVARTEAWIRLCYLNQGTSGKLVEFR